MKISGCTINEKCRPYSHDSKSDQILFIASFLIEKNEKYSWRASCEVDLADGKFSIKGNFIQLHSNLFLDHVNI